MFNRYLAAVVLLLVTGCSIKTDSNKPKAGQSEAEWQRELKLGEELIGERKFKKAEKHILSALKLAKKFGPKDKRVASSLGDLAVIYGAKKDYKKAVDTMEEALTIDRHIYGDNHEFVAYDLNNLGTFYDVMGDHKKATPYLEESVKIRNELANLDPKSQKLLATSLVNLGTNNKFLGNYDKAETLTKKAIKISQNVGDYDTEILYTKSLASIYDNAGTPEKIDKLYKEMQKEFSLNTDKSQGLESKLLLTAAHYFSDKKNFKKAESYYEQALKTAESNHGKGSRIVLGVTFSVIANLMTQKKYKKAIPHLERLINDKSFSSLNSKMQIDLYKHYALCLYNSGQREKSQKITHKVMEMQKKGMK